MKFEFNTTSIALTVVTVILGLVQSAIQEKQIKDAVDEYLKERV